MMDCFNSTTILVLFCLVVGVTSVGTGGSCSSNADCIATNIHSHCYHWITENSCPLGTCRCNPGYGGFLCAPLLNIQTIDEPCNSTFVCEEELHCDFITRICVCATSTFVFKPALNTCLAEKSRVINQTCTTSDECYNWRGAVGGVECRGTGTKTCQCKAGYVEIEGLCQKPHYGHTCNTDVGCTMMTHPEIRIDDPSRVTEACISGECACPDGSYHAVTAAFEEILHYCLSYPDVPLKMAGQTCTHSNECVTKVCIACPGAVDSQRTCAHIKSAGTGSRLDGLMIGVIFGIMMIL